MSEVGEIGFPVETQKREDNIDLIIRRVVEWSEGNEEIKEEMDDYSYAVSSIMDDSFTAYSERKDFVKIIDKMPNQIIDRVSSEFGAEMVVPVIKRITEYVTRDWGSRLLSTYDQIDGKIIESVDHKKSGYKLSSVCLKGMDNLSIAFNKDGDDSYEDNFKLNDLTWIDSATMRLSQRRFGFSIDGLYRLINPRKEGPRYTGDVRRNREIYLGNENDRFNELRDELFKKMDFFIVVFNGFLDQYFSKDRRKIDDINWSSLSASVKPLLTDGSERNV